MRLRETVEGWENHYGWDFIFSGEEGQLVVEGNYIIL